MKLTRGEEEAVLQLARDYGEAGFYKEALWVLMLGRERPMIEYYKGYYFDLIGDREAAFRCIRNAESLAPDYTFPNKLEDIAVLKHASSLNPDGARAYYYLGNLYYDKRQYDKARELVQSRQDKDVLTRTWNEMNDKIQRMEISVENKQFKRFFKQISTTYPNRWLLPNQSSTTREQKNEEYRKGLEYFFYDLGMNEDIRAEMFNYFSNHLLHFKLRNHDKTQISILDLSVNSLTELKRLGKKKK